MKAYIEYKSWWIEHEALSRVPCLYWGENAEQAFEQHVKDLGLYGLMERLADWEDE